MKAYTCRYLDGPKCQGPFDSPSAVRIHYRDDHDIQYPAPPPGGKRKLVLTGDHYILPQRLRDTAAQLIRIADEMDRYIQDTSEAREKLKEYQALIDMARKLR